MKIKYLVFTIVTIFLCFNKLRAIDDISINNYSLFPNFDKDVKVYNVFVPTNKEIITINAISSSNETVTGTGSKSLKIGLNEMEIKSYVDDILVSSYLLKITRGDVLFNENDSYLKSLKIDGYEIDFEKDRFDYYLDAKDDERLYITYDTFNPKEKVIIDGDITLKNEKNVIIINVTSENKKNNSTYKIYVNKQNHNINEKVVKTSIFDNENFSDEDLRIIRNIIIFIEFLLLGILFYIIILKKRTSKVLYIKRSILHK